MLRFSLSICNTGRGEHKVEIVHGEHVSSMSQHNILQTSIIPSLYIEALRQGQSLWFRVISNSMAPTLRVGDSVYIEPATAKAIRVGEIAAFETPDGLVIHRIVQHQQTGAAIRLLQMADVELHTSWIEEQAVVGRVCIARRQSSHMNLQHPIAQWCGKITARLRYLLYLWKVPAPLRRVLHICSRWVVSSSYLCIRCCCTSLVKHDKSPFVDQVES